MSIHRVRLFHSTAGASGFHNWLSVWLTNMTPWEADEVTNEVPVTWNAGVGNEGTEAFHAELAFEWTQDRDIILDNLNQQMAAWCDWNRLFWHECSHDESQPQPCEWNEKRENGTVPADIPDWDVTPL